MKFKVPFAALCMLSFSLTAGFAEEVASGLQNLFVAPTPEGRQFDGYIWYPTEDRGPVTQAHGNAVWQSLPTRPDAAPKPGQKPLVLMSHGMFGNARNQAWLAQSLVAEGFVVAAVNHPGTTTFQRDPDDRRELWRRPQDISQTLDQLLADPTFAPLIDPDRIFMAGHSLGGWTAMTLAGARFEKAALDRFCASDDADLVCELFARWGIAASETDRAAMESDLKDPRIKAIAVFDLGGTQTFSKESLAEITTPLLVYGAPRGDEALNLDVESRALVAALPESNTTYLEPKRLAHFDFLGVCTDMGLAILKEEEPQDAYVCEEGTGERRDEHAQIAREVIAFFQKQ
ncbi:MAG: alpha/beta fold hydrolase [Pseudomonadota bacterium]